VEKQWEDITFQSTTAPKTWFEDANTFRALKGNRLFTYHLDTNTWDEPEVLYKNEDSDGVPLSEKSKLCGTYNDHIYFSQAGKVYRYPVGDPVDVSYVGKPNLPLTKPFSIQNDTFYFEYQSNDFYSTDYFVYLYKMPMSSLLDGSNQVTCIGSPNGIDNRTKVNLYETDTHYLVTLNGTVKAMKK
jgi:hypothetical protein